MHVLCLCSEIEEKQRAELALRNLQIELRAAVSNSKQVRAADVTDVCLLSSIIFAALEIYVFKFMHLPSAATVSYVIASCQLRHRQLLCCSWTRRKRTWRGS